MEHSTLIYSGSPGLWSDRSPPVSRIKGCRRLQLRCVCLVFFQPALPETPFPWPAALSAMQKRCVWLNVGKCLEFRGWLCIWRDAVHAGVGSSGATWLQLKFGDGWPG